MDKPSATKFLEEVNQAQGEEVMPTLERLLAAKHTGAIILHVTQGRAQVLEWRKKLSG